MPPLSTGRNGASTSTVPDSTVLSSAAPRRRHFRLPVMSRVSIQSKLLVMLLITSVLSAAVVGFIGLSSGRASLQASVFDRMTEIRQFIVNGKVRLVVSGDDGVMIPVRTLDEGDFLGQTTLTREPVTASAYAMEEATVLQIDRAHVEDLVARKPLLLQDIGRAIEERRNHVQRAQTVTAD